MRKHFLRIGAALMALAVMAGAFGAHALTGVLDEAHLKTYDTANRYHFYHALGMLLVGMLLYFRKTSLTPWAGWLFLGGIVLFSGSLYLLSFADILALPTGLLGPITPIGGVLFIAGWVVLALSTLQDNEKRYRKADRE